MGEGAVGGRSWQQRNKLIAELRIYVCQKSTINKIRKQKSTWKAYLQCFLTKIIFFIKLHVDNKGKHTKSNK